MENCEYFAYYFHENMNYCQDKSLLFLLDLRLADVAPVYRKKPQSCKDNYRPVSILSNIFKVYESWIYDQVLSYFDKSYLANNVDFVKVIMCNTV